MSHYSARIEDGVVTQVVVGDFDSVSILLAGNWVPVDDEEVYPGVGWSWDGTSFLPPPFVESE